MKLMKCAPEKPVFCTSTSCTHGDTHKEVDSCHSPCVIFIKSGKVYTACKETPLSEASNILGDV